MRRVSDIVAVLISLEVRSECELMVLVTGDGSVNRMGTGAKNNTERDLFIGVTKEPLLPQLLAHLNDEMLSHTGFYDLSNEMRGDPCRLSIHLKFEDGSEDGFGFSYGSESRGPPPSICDLIQAAAFITQPWYLKQKAMVARSRRTAKLSALWTKVKKLFT